MKNHEIDESLTDAHNHCGRHKEEVLASSVCGCFYCLANFPPLEIKKWVNGSGTALCPHCGIDAVLGDKSGLPVTDVEFLSKMKNCWFDEP